jgi:gliding motility-associated-like protein
MKKLSFLIFCVLIYTKINAQNISLFKQIGGKVDYTMIGNTLNTQENNDDNFPGYLTSTSATLVIPAGSTIKNAYLYWAGTGNGDFNITLNGVATTPDRRFTAPITPTRRINAFGAFKDVTNEVKAIGTNTYTVTDLVPELVFGLNGSSGNFGGWCIVVVYENPTLPVNLINVYDGFEAVPELIRIELNSLDVVAQPGSKIGFLAWEGDKALAINEKLSVQPDTAALPTTMSNDVNPETNAFNGTNSITGSTTLYNMDIDVYDIENIVSVGNKSITVTLESGERNPINNQIEGDVVIVNTIVTKLNSKLPDATVEIGDVSQKCNSRELTVKYTVRNAQSSTGDFLQNTNVSIYANNIFLGVFPTTALVPIGGSLDMTSVVTLPAGVPDTFDLKIVVDDNNGVSSIIEINEDNNESLIKVITLETFNPTGTISYASPFCANLNVAQQVSTTVNPAGTGTYSATPAGLTINATTGAITPNTSTPNTYTVTYTIPAKGTCPPFTTTASVVINTAPAPTVVTPLSYCLGSTAPPLTATTIAGGSLLWYTTATGGTGSPTAPTPLTTNQGNTSYFVSQVIANCESPRVEIVVTINPKPIIKIPSGSICFDKDNNVVSPFIIDSGLDPAVYSFEWFRVEGTTTTLIAGETQSTYSASALGNYGLIATTILDKCASEIAIATVTKYNSPQKIIINSSEYFTNGHTVEVSVIPPGDYEYQLNDGAFQTNNVFNNLPAGTYTVTVKDINECGELSETATLVGYPNYFTPNGDGVHDTWNIWELRAIQPNSVINIFDRYGKFLKQISPIGPGWDGTYNGYTALETDYWFTVTYDEKGETNKVFRAHFSLVRQKRS